MVGAMLSRVLSARKKMASADSSLEHFKEKLDYPYPPVSDILSLEATQTWAVDQQCQASEPKARISFDQGTYNRSVTQAMKLPASTRKHSYASVKEDSDIPQSFSSRRLTDLVDKASRQSQRNAQANETAVDSSDDDDEATVSDDEDTEVRWVPRNDSLTSDSILSATRIEPASFESMPDEILDLIFSLVTLDTAKDRYADPKVDLFACLQVSRAIHAAALRVLYRHVKIPQSKAFFKFTNSIAEDPSLGDLVQCLDFSHYSSIGFGRTRTNHTQVPYLTPSTLRACLKATKSLKAFLVHEHIDDELDIGVLSDLFDMPSLRALDLCSCSSQPFTEALTTVCTQVPRWGSTTNFLTIERLSLHECTTLKSQVFEALMPRLSKLTHLDVAHTMINDKALLSLPTSARITHLNLERCTQLTGPTVVKFLTQHPAVKNRVVYLNLMADASRYRMLDEEDLHRLLPALPPTLRSLNVGGSRVNGTHAPALRVLATHLEELGLKGANLSFGSDIARILSLTSTTSEGEAEHLEWKSTLRYLDLTDVKSVSKMSLTYSPTTIIGNESVPLEVIELGSSLIDDLGKSVKKQKTPEWIVRELGRRGWFVRQTNLLPSWLYSPDDGYRQWKMGARWWGMRKIPMFEQDTGGMYGYFMFKRS